MLQEDINNKTVALATNSAKMTTRVLLKMIDAFLKYQKGKASGVKHGKQSIKNLAKQGKSMTNIEITNKNIKSFEKYARKYNVDYALKKIHYKDDDGFDKYKHVVFFKAQDSESIKLAFTEYSKDMLERSNSKNTPILDTLENYRDRLEAKVQEPEVEVLPQEEILQLENKEEKDVAVPTTKSDEEVVKEVKEPLSKANESKEEVVKEVKEPPSKANESKEEVVKEIKEPPSKANESKEEVVKEIKEPPSKANESKEEKDEVVPTSKDNDSKEDSNKEKLVKDTKKLPTYEAETPEEIAGLMESYNPADFGEYNPYEDEDIQQNFFNDFEDMPMSVSDEEYMDTPFNYGNEFFEDTTITQENVKENISNSNKDKKLAKNKNKGVKEQLESSRKDKLSKTKVKTQEIKKPKPKSRGGDAR